MIKASKHGELDLWRETQHVAIKCFREIFVNDYGRVHVDSFTLLGICSHFSLTYFTPARKEKM